MAVKKKGLTHVAADGSARMVDVSAKPDTLRIARASGHIEMQPATLAAIMASSVSKGDVIGVARLAGVMAAKRTSDLIPLCHPVALTDVDVTIVPANDLPGLRAEAVVRCYGKTGVEMEALTAVSAALLTVYDMAKAIDREMVIGEVRLEEKTGGASGAFSRA